MESINLGFGSPEEIAEKINLLGITSGVVVRDDDAADTGCDPWWIVDSEADHEADGGTVSASWTIVDFLFLKEGKIS